MAVGVSMNMVCVVVALLAAVMTTVQADEVNICKRCWRSGRYPETALLLTLTVFLLF
jgi:hypothetical protein